MALQHIANYYLDSILRLYIKNYKPEQLNLKFGKASLNDLYVQESAINTLNFPVKLLQGYIKNLTLQVNFNNIYNAKLSLAISDVYLVLLPNFGHEPDEESERKSRLQTKKLQLEKLEQSLKKLMEEPGSTQVQDTDTFVTKLILQIFNNVQIKISNVHIRLEDTVSHPQKAFTFGFTFHSLEFVSQEQEKETQYKPINFGNIILKVAKLSYLSVYFKTHSNKQDGILSSLHDQNKINTSMGNLIASQTNTPSDLDYLLSPNQFSANIFVHRKPQEDAFRIPLLDLKVVLDSFAINFSKTQYDSLVYLLENVNRLSISVEYRKWRPKEPVHENAKLWWQFAITAVLETQVRRRRRNWNNMKEYINGRKKYKMLFKKKLLSDTSKPHESLEIKLSELEEKLDLASLVLIRKQVNLEVKDELQIRKQKQKQEESKGFFGGWGKWFSKNEQNQQESLSMNLVSDVQKELNKPEEKLKLYEAIGYDELQKMIDYPLGYIAQVFNFTINQFTVSVHDNEQKRRIVHFLLDEVSMKVDILPTSQGIVLNTSINSMKVYGLKSETLPMVEPLDNDPALKMLKISFELNPINASPKYDFGLYIQTQGLRFVYDANTIKELTNLGRSPDAQSLQQIQAMAVITYNEFRLKSAENMHQSIMQHKKLKLDIDIKPSIVLVPEMGDIQGGRNVLLICLGNMSITSKLIEHNREEFRRLLETSPEDLIQTLRTSAYENYSLKVSKIQIAFSDSSSWKQDVQKIICDEDLDEEILKKLILHPIYFDTIVSRCIIDDDPELPLVKIDGIFHSFHLSARSDRLVKLLRLIQSITDVEESKPDFNPESPSLINTLPASTNDVIQVLELQRNEMSSYPSSSSVIQKTTNQLAASFKIDKVLFEVFTAKENQIFRCEMSFLNAQFQMKNNEIDLEAVVSELQFMLCVDYYFDLLVLQEELSSIKSAYPEAPEIPIVKPTTTNAIVPKQSKSSAPTRATNSSSFCGRFHLSAAKFALLHNLTDQKLPMLLFNFVLSASCQQVEETFLIETQMQRTQMAIMKTECFFKDINVDMFILSPCEINMHFKQDMFKQTINLDINRFKIHISPNLVQVLNTLMAKISKPTIVITDNDVIRDEELMPKSRLLSVCPFKSKNRWYLPLEFEPFDSPLIQEIPDDTITISDTASIASNNQCDTPSMDDTRTQEQLIVANIPELQLVIESGGADSKPMLKMHCNIFATFSNASSLKIKSACFVDYFNETKHAWEPVIDRINGKAWPFDFFMKMMPRDDNPVPRKDYYLKSAERLELTFTNNCLGVLSDLSDSFSKAVTQPDLLSSKRPKFQVFNYTGFKMHFIINSKKFKMENNTSGPLIFLKESEMVSVPLDSGENCSLKTISSGEQCEEINYVIKYENFEMNRTLSLNVRDKRVLEIYNLQYPKQQWQYVIDMTKVDSGTRHIIFRSNVEIRNNTEYSLELLQMDETKTTMLTILEPGAVFYVPTWLVHSIKPCLYARRSGYLVPFEPLSWKVHFIEHKKHYSEIRCESMKENEPDFVFQAVIHVDKVFHDHPANCTCAQHKLSSLVCIQLRPQIILRNLLPYSLSICQYKPDRSAIVLNPGQEQQLIHFQEEVTVFRIVLKNYQGNDWTYFTKPIRFAKEEKFRIVEFVVRNSNDDKSLLIAWNCNTSDEKGNRVVSFYVPFWMINQTGRNLKYSMEEEVFVQHDARITDPVLLCYKEKHAESKKRLCVAMPGCKFSDPFSIDVAGTKGSVAITGKRLVNLCSVDISMSNFLLTKIIKIGPFSCIVNHFTCPLEASEDNDVWFTLKQRLAQPFWPQKTKKPVLFFRWPGSQISSKPISIENSSGTLFLIDQVVVFCRVETTNHSIKIELSRYSKGLAPAQLINYTDDISINYGQAGMSRRNSLPPMTKVYFLWPDPNLKKKLLWSADDSEEIEAQIESDGFGKTNSGNVFWISFLDGKQRVFLVTKDARVPDHVLQAKELLKPDLRLELALNGVGVSLVDTVLWKELCYLSISSSEPVWEYSKKRGLRFVGFSTKTTGLLEQAYRKYVECVKKEEHDEENWDEAQQQVVGENLSKVRISDNILVDFKTMKMIRPQEGAIRRFGSIGLRVKASVSPHITQFFAIINRVQLDNQMEDCKYPVILCPVDPPKSVVQDLVPQPFLQISVVQQTQESLRRFQYLSFLVQEFAIQIDLDFINRMQSYLDVFEESLQLNYEELVSVSIQNAKMSELDTFTQDNVKSKVCYIDLLHFAPIKMHLSFSLGNLESVNLPGIIDYFVKSAGVTLIEFSDAVFRIHFFEIKNQVISDDQLWSRLMEHYKSQALSQWFLVVFGLDVLGNPAGLLLGLKQGVGDMFYEPLMGIIQGPGEFVEGITLGVRSLFSSTVGGAAGVLGKITGQIGEGLSSLMDSEDRRKRRERLNQTRTLAQGSRNVARGFISGITGVFTKPVEGAKKKGFEGLFKGVGQGVVGLVTKPTTGIIDFTSGALNQFQRTVNINEEVERVRLRRHLHSNGVVTSFSLHEAHGKQIFAELRKPHSAVNDVYENHIQLPMDRVLMLTNKHVMLLDRDILFKSLNVSWYFDVRDLVSCKMTDSYWVELSVKNRKEDYRVNCGSYQIAKAVNDNVKELTNFLV